MATSKKIIYLPEDDVEQIVNQNADRVRWAAELAREPEKAPVRREPKRRSESRFQALHTAVLACAMFAGAGAAFVVIGLASGDAVSVIVGLLAVNVFISSGARLDWVSRSV